MFMRGARLRPVQKVRSQLIGCGDGGMVCGGQEALHAGSPVMAALCERTSWDVFHRVDKAGERAFKASAVGGEFLNLSKRSPP